MVSHTAITWNSEAVRAFCRMTHGYTHDRIFDGFGNGALIRYGRSPTNRRIDARRHNTKTSGEECHVAHQRSSEGAPFSEKKCRPHWTLCGLSRSRADGMHEGTLIMCGLKPGCVLISVKVVTSQSSHSNRIFRTVPDYESTNVSKKLCGSSSTMSIK